MNWVLFDSIALQAQGLQHRSAIADETFFIFPYVERGTFFHSKNVPEPFDLAFLDKDHRIIFLKTIVPQEEIAWAPPAAFMAVESKAGFFARRGLKVGSIFLFEGDTP